MTNEAIIHYDLRLDVLAELMEAGIASICSDPESLSEKQAEMDIRKDAVLSIAGAFKKAGKGLNKDKLATAARKLARYFPPEAGIDAIEPRMVRHILITKNRA